MKKLNITESVLHTQLPSCEKSVCCNILSSVLNTNCLRGQMLLIILSILVLVFGNVSGEMVGGTPSFNKSVEMMQHSGTSQDTGDEQDNDSWIIGRAGGQTVCKSVDIRNDIAGWKARALAHCDIIEGYLSLIVIKQGQTHAAISNVSFPRLKQVTSYALFYRMSGLRSFSEMFPNLAVIRGYRLFHEYGLVVYENLQLRELGLVGLRRVLRGAVRVEKNTHICFLDTVDWRHITNRTDDVIQDSAEGCRSDTCPKRCSNFSSQQGERLACWNLNPNGCQLLHDRHKCHSNCEGGCTRANSASHCVACKHVNFNGTCMTVCPDGTYLYEGWRCIRSDECTGTQPGRPDTEKYKAFKGVCISKCPVGYTASNNETACKKCIGGCPKVCLGRMIDSASRAQAFKGCTIIQGSLRIQVSGNKIVQELEENLADIREIGGYLRISYSEPLVSLSFLRNLRVIHGKELVSKLYALYFLHNHNLVSLWPKNFNLTVKQGRAFFHFNHKLCLDVINELITKLNIDKQDTIDVGLETNGDKVPCRRINMSAEVRRVTKHYVIIQWENFRHRVKDYRTLLGYNVYYREASQRNISLFSGRDACSDDMWKMFDFPATDEYKSGSVIVEMLTGLKPYTQYALYVDTLMVGTGNTAVMGQSPVIYFTSLAAVPTVPRGLKVYALESELRLEWDPPAVPNGVITHYYVVARYTPETLDPNIDYCKEPGAVVRLPPVPVARTPASNVSASAAAGGISGISVISGGGGVGVEKEQCCVCYGDNKPGKTSKTISVTKTTEQNEFEDFLQNAVFRRNTKKNTSKRSRQVGGRRRRSINSTVIDPIIGHSDDVDQGIYDDDEEEEDDEAAPVGQAAAGEPSPKRDSCVRRHANGWCMTYEIDLPANGTTKNGTTLRELQHYAEYTVEVYACEHMRSCRDESRKDHRSPAAIASRKTLKNETADALSSRPVISNKTTAGHVTLSWHDPVQPNGGHVLSYTIYIRRVDGEVEEVTSKRDKCPADRCDSPPCKQELQLQLAIGNISIQVQARTLAGPGPLSQPLYYLVVAPKSELSWGEVIAIVIGVLLVICTLGVIAICYRRNAKPPLDSIYTSWNPYYGGQMPYQVDDWEVDMEKVYFDRVIGSGSFGSVYEGTALLRDRETDDDTEQLYRVAVKTLLETANMYERQAFLAEASLMKEFRCNHVVRLMGIASNMSAKTASDIPRPPFVIMELMAKGDLKSYLRSMRPDESDYLLPDHYPVLSNIYTMAIQIADGMAYLAQMNSVHRDLAARNCLVSEDVTIKIGDFGMTRHLYDKNYYRKDGKGFLPVRWMGPESLRDGRFTSQSDVWSFGVVLWEMATYGAQPYQGLSNEEVIKHVTSRNRMSRPETCPQRLYELMCRCWEFRSNDRPTFVTLVELLLPLVDAQQFSRHSFYHTQRPALLSAAALERDPEPEPTVLTPLTGSTADDRGGEGDGGGAGGTLPRHPRIAEAEDLTDVEDGDLEMRPIQHVHTEANYAEFAAMKPARNGGQGSMSSAENSKAHSLQFSSSDGSKDSKASNGSAPNGYIASGGALSVQRTAEC